MTTHYTVFDKSGNGIPERSFSIEEGAPIEGHAMTLLLLPNRERVFARVIEVTHSKDGDVRFVKLQVK